MTNSEVLLTLVLFGLGYWVVARLFERSRQRKARSGLMPSEAGEQEQTQERIELRHGD